MIATEAARIIHSITKIENPPFRLPLTQGAIDSLEAKSKDYRQTIENWKETAGKVDNL